MKRIKSFYEHNKLLLERLDGTDVELKEDRIRKIQRQYKKILSDSGFKLRRGTSFYDPPTYWDVSDLTHEPIAAPEQVVRCLVEYYKNGFSLLDIGAGYGNIMKISEIIGYKSTGIELKDTSEYTKGLDIIYDDFFNVDCDIISKFDVIYFYRPFQNEDQMDIFLDKVHNCSKTGAVIIYLQPHIYGPEGLKKYKKFKFIESFDYGRQNDDNGIVFKKI